MQKMQNDAISLKTVPTLQHTCHEKHILMQLFMQTTPLNQIWKKKNTKNKNRVVADHKIKNKKTLRVVCKISYCASLKP